jgi:hypothetical protein
MHSTLRATLYRLDRSSERLEIGRASTLRGPNHHPIDIRIEDLSATGCRLNCDSQLAVDEYVMVGLPGVGIRASRVVWTDGVHVGCAFEEPLTPADVKAIQVSEPLTFVDFRSFPTPRPATDPKGESETPFSPRQRLGIVLASALGAWGLVALLAAVALLLF